MRQTGFIRGIRTWLKINKKDGFVCQSCAWPSPDEDRKVFEFCESGVKALSSETTKKQITADFFRANSIADLQKHTDFWLERQGRLVRPMVKRAGATHYEPIEWDDAFQLLALELNALPSPDAAAFYTSGRTSNEAAFLYQLFARQFGTNNLPDCSNMCHESSGSALKESIGIGKGCVTLEDFEGRRHLHPRPESRDQPPAHVDYAGTRKKKSSENRCTESDAGARLDAGGQSQPAGIRQHPQVSGEDAF